MAGADRISALPLEIKVSILCCLNVKDAVRTSSLARSWRRIWTFLPCLHLGRYKYQSDNSYSDFPVKLTKSDNSYYNFPVTIKSARPTLKKKKNFHVASNWIKLVRHLVSTLQGPLLVFKLGYIFHSNESALLQSLLNLLLRKGGIETLGLCSFFGSRVVVNLPSFLSLKVLQLCGCHLVLPTGFQGFNGLTTLVLIDVKISNDDLRLMIHTSKKLTSFQNSYFVVSEDPLSLYLSSPLLRHLALKINESIEKVSVISAPCLEQAHITIGIRSSSEKLAWVTLELVTSVSMVSSLYLNCAVLQLVNNSRQTNRVTISIIRDLLEKKDGLSYLDQTLKSVITSMDTLDVIECKYASASEDLV